MSPQWYLCMCNNYKTVSMGYLLKCRYYFQMLATEVLIAQGFYGIIQHFGWKRVGIISQDENLFTQVNETYYIPPTFLYCLPLFVQVLANTCIDLWYWWADTFTSPIIKRPYIFWCISHTLWASNLYTAHRVGIIAGFYELHLPSKCLCGAYHNKLYSNENSELINKSHLYINIHARSVFQVWAQIVTLKHLSAGVTQKIGWG